VEGAEEGHALNDPLRRVFWSLSIAIESLSIVCVGVVLYQILGDDIEQSKYLYNALASAVSVSMICLSCVDLCHFLTFDILRDPRWVLLGSVRVILIAMFFASFGFDAAVPELYLAYVAVVISLAIVFHVKVQRFRQSVISKCARRCEMRRSIRKSHCKTGSSSHHGVEDDGHGAKAEEEVAVDGGLHEGHIVYKSDSQTSGGSDEDVDSGGWVGAQAVVVADELEVTAVDSEQVVPRLSVSGTTAPQPPATMVASAEDTDTSDGQVGSSSSVLSQA
jgi:hypothetical protein